MLVPGHHRQIGSQERDTLDLVRSVHVREGGLHRLLHSAPHGVSPGEASTDDVDQRDLLGGELAERFRIALKPL
jgi:hypothetical protein